VERVRIAGAVLASAAALLAILFAKMGIFIPALTLIVGAGAMAAVVPNPALEPSQRKRVVAGASAYSIMMLVTMVTVRVGSDNPAQMTLPAIALLGGLVVTGWAFMTRNRRRRRTGLRAYFDESS
jgi:hypothetical protein